MKYPLIHPVFSTGRLELRKFSVLDAKGFYRLNADPQVLQFTGDSPFTSVEEAAWFIQHYDHYDHYGYGRWSVYLKGTKTYLGFCGLNYRVPTKEVDIGFRILRSYWGQGYATEAAQASIQHGFQVYGLSRIVARAMLMNTGSQRVIEKLGMRYVKQFVDEGAVWVLYELLHGGGS